MTYALTLKTAKFLAAAKVEGKTVSFFTPPHCEPDFPWVDMQELIAAFCSPAEAATMTHMSQSYTHEGTRTAATAINGDRIATIICHSQAQGLCGAIDHMNGFTEGGPALNAYCTAAGITAVKHWNFGLEHTLAAFGNVGGPFMRAAK